MYKQERIDYLASRLSDLWEEINELEAEAVAVEEELVHLETQRETSINVV